MSENMSVFRAGVRLCVGTHVRACDHVSPYDAQLSKNISPFVSQQMSLCVCFCMSQASDLISPLKQPESKIVKNYQNSTDISSVSHSPWSTDIYALTFNSTERLQAVGSHCVCCWELLGCKPLGSRMQHLLVAPSNRLLPRLWLHWSVSFGW